MSGRTEKFKVRDSKMEPRTQFVFMELGHTSILDLPPNLKLYLRTQSEFRLSQAWAKSAKNIIARDPPMQSLFLRRPSVAHSRSFQQALGGLGRTSGGLGDALGETWAKLAKTNREGPPYTMTFLRRKSSAESPGSSSQLRKRATLLPPVKQDQTPI